MTTLANLQMMNRLSNNIWSKSFWPVKTRETADGSEHSSDWRINHRGLETVEEKFQKISVYTKPLQSHQSGLVSVTGPGALVTELISEDEIECIPLSDEPGLTIDVSTYTIAHINIL